MGELERIHASFGASFGNYGQRVNGAQDRNPKRHQQEQHAAKEDALELHESEEAAPTAIEKPTIEVVDGEDHLDLSA